MTQMDKDSLQNKQFTESLLIACLATCETIISKNAYLEKKWKNGYENSYGYCWEGYAYERTIWMRYREKIRPLLLPTYPMDVIKQMVKDCPDKSTQKAVKDIIELIKNNDYVLV